MKSIKKAILIHLFMWLLVSLVFFAGSETITKKLFPGYDDVSMWLMVTGKGLLLIFIVVMVSLLRKLLIIRKTTADQKALNH